MLVHPRGFLILFKQEKQSFPNDTVYLQNSSWLSSAVCDVISSKVTLSYTQFIITVPSATISHNHVFQCKHPCCHVNGHPIKYKFSSSGDWLWSITINARAWPSHNSSFRYVADVIFNGTTQCRINQLGVRMKTYWKKKRQGKRIKRHVHAPFWKYVFHIVLQVSPQNLKAICTKSLHLTLQLIRLRSLQPNLA